MKYRFEIIYSTPPLKKISDHITQLGFETGEIGFQEVLTFNSKEEIAIEHLKEIIKTAFNSHQYEILKIEGGKIE